MATTFPALRVRPLQSSYSFGCLLASGVAGSSRIRRGCKNSIDNLSTWWNFKIKLVNSGQHHYLIIFRITFRYSTFHLFCDLFFYFISKPHENGATKKSTMFAMWLQDSTEISPSDPHKFSPWRSKVFLYKLWINIHLERKPSIHIKSVHGGNKFPCTHCESTFTQNGYLQLHIKSVHEGKMFPCTQCGSTFTEKRRLQIYIKSVHEGQTFSCTHCGATFT